LRKRAKRRRRPSITGISFLIVAFVLFMAVKAMNQLRRK